MSETFDLTKVFKGQLNLPMPPLLNTVKIFLSSTTKGSFIIDYALKALKKFNLINLIILDYRIERDFIVEALYTDLRDFVHMKYGLDLTV